MESLNTWIFGNVIDMSHILRYIHWYKCLSCYSYFPFSLVLNAEIFDKANLRLTCFNRWGAALYQTIIKSLFRRLKMFLHIYWNIFMQKPFLILPVNENLYLRLHCWTYLKPCMGNQIDLVILVAKATVVVIVNIVVKTDLLLIRNIPKYLFQWK